VQGSNTTTVTFEDTKIPIENVLGEVGGGFKIAVRILNNGRFGMGAGTASGIRKMVSLIAEHAKARVQFGRPLKVV
jgi:alkylation response protein AidB-like acyl-CoA dehydrogenase